MNIYHLPENIFKIHINILNVLLCVCKSISKTTGELSYFNVYTQTNIEIILCFTGVVNEMFLMCTYTPKTVQSINNVNFLILNFVQVFKYTGCIFWHNFDIIFILLYYFRMEILLERR